MAIRSRFLNSGLNAMMPGLTAMAQAVAGGDQAYREGRDNAALLQSKLAQALAQAKRDNAAADHYGAQADVEYAKARTLDRRPQLFEEQAANFAGVDIPTVRNYRTQLRTGQAPMVPMGPEEEDGSMGQGSFVLPAATKTKLAGALQQFLPLLANSGDLKPDDLSKAAGDFRTMSLSDAIIAGRADRNTVGGAQAAAAGKDLFKTDTTGAVLDQFTGGLNTANPMAQSTIGLRGAQAGQAKAAAADHYAGAGLKKAQRDEVVSGPKGQLVQTDAGPVFADPRTGRSVPVVGADGKPAAGKLKEIPATAGARILEAKHGLMNIDDAIAAIEKTPGALGFSNAIPGAQTAKQMWASPDEVSTRAKVANIGSLVLHDRSGAAVSASEFPRLAPFIPSASDNAKTAIQKLRDMKRIAEDELGLFAGVYNESNGYKSSPIMSNRNVLVDY